VKVKDRQGNLTRIERTISVGVTELPAGREVPEGSGK
jgi:hypothetical protein